MQIDPDDPLLQITRWRDAGKMAALATVVRTWGSSPRPEGSHLAVDEDGNFVGPIQASARGDMIFKEFTCEEAEGLILAHTLRLGDRTLKKGKLLASDDIATLLSMGITEVTGARLEPGDVGENPAAWAIAQALAGENIDCRRPVTGRANLHAAVSGVVVIERERLDQINLLDEAVTVGTLAPCGLVRKGQVVATIKIIPFAVKHRLIEACQRVVAGRPPIRIAPMVPHRAALIMSELPGVSPRALDNAAVATRLRLEALGSRLVLELRCPHAPAPAQRALDQALSAGCDLILVSGATVTKDRCDVIPSAIATAGGAIDHFGMPVEPGNMLLLAHIGAVPVINLPGCARSHRLNGFDWVLQRLLAGLPVTSRDIMLMGVGGLIRSSSARDDCEPPAELGAFASPDEAAGRAA